MRCHLHLTFVALAGLQLAAMSVSAQPEADTLRFDAPMLAAISARYWDQTQAQWMTDADRAHPLFFDAVHRFLWLRFPGAAEAIRERLQAGQEIASAALAMRWTGQEFMREPGYVHRSWPLEGKPEPDWHARVWLLRRPWVDDPEIGPTWNSYLNGLGFWRGGGGRDGSDRFPAPLAEVLLGATALDEQPFVEADVTAALTSDDFGSAGERLRRIADCGFLLNKAELFNQEYGEMAGALGLCRIFIAEPALVVRFRPGQAQVAELPAAQDARALAERLRAEGPDGEPTSRIPEDLDRLLAEYRARHHDLPAPMREHVAQIANLSTRWDDALPVYWQLMDPAAAEPERYLAIVDSILALDPGYFKGHSHVDPIITLLDCGHLLPEVARYHLRMNTQARWTRPFDPEGIRHRVGYFGGMATLNHQCQFRSEALLAGEILDDPDLTMMARRNLSLLMRQMLFLDGVVQEHGDSFYHGISLATLKTAATYCADPLTRLKADLGIERMIWELNATYHPGLRRHVSSVARRYRVNTLILDQDIPRAVLHTLSRDRVLIETDQQSVHDVPVIGFNSTPPQRVANLAPWGQEYEANAIDDKPLPFLSMGASLVRGLAPDPIYYITYMGRNYALGSCHVDMDEQWPNQAVWRRTPEPVTRLDDLGIMFVWPYMNDVPINDYTQDQDDAIKSTSLMVQLQHENRLICVMRPTERQFLGEYAEGGVRSFFSRASIFAYGPEEGRRIFVGDTPLTTFPATARQGDRIALDEGATYVGLIPLPATDLGRRQEVAISYEYPRLDLDSYCLDAEQPLPDEDATWQRLMTATNGWVIELADAEDYESFEAFRAHLAEMSVESAWHPEEGRLDITCADEERTLELGFLPGYERPRDDRPYPLANVIAHARVNGEWPWLPDGLLLDSPLGQLSATGHAEKAGATLDTLAGQSAMLKVEPVSGTYVAINPVVDPVPLELATPEGAIVRAEGQFGCGRILVRPAESLLQVDHYLPPPGGELGAARLQDDAAEGQHAGPAEWEEPLLRFMRPGFDVRTAREQTARALLVTGMAEPLRVVLNGEALTGALQRVEADGRTWLRVPIAPQD